MSKDDKSELTKWYKPDGTKIMLNDLNATVDMAVSLGWDTEKPSKKAK